MPAPVVGSDEGRRTASVLSTFVAGCRRHDIDPLAYVRDVLTNFAACPMNDIDQFPPARLQAVHVSRPA